MLCLVVAFSIAGCVWCVRVCSVCTYVVCTYLSYLTLQHVVRMGTTRQMSLNARYVCVHVCVHVCVCVCVWNYRMRAC